MTTTSKQPRKRSTIDWDSITISDNYMFVTVFSDPELCRELLQRVLGMRIREVVITQSEKTLKTDPYSHAVRMDVYAADSDTVYDIEMQTSDQHNLEKRSRYYLSTIDRDCLDAGTPYEEVVDSIVIFICTFDPFERGLPRYTITPHCREDGKEMDDGTMRVFVNSTAWDDCDDPKLRAFLRYVAEGIIEDDDKFLGDVDGSVRRQRERPEWRRIRMLFSQELMWERARGRAEGRDIERRENALLLQALREVGREGEIFEATIEPGVREKLLAEFGIAIQPDTNL